MVINILKLYIYICIYIEILYYLIKKCNDMKYDLDNKME